MKKLSKTQRDLLDTVAAAGKRGLMCPPESSNPKLEATLTSLIRRNLLTCTERRGGGHFLRLTAEGETVIVPKVPDAETVDSPALLPVETEPPAVRSGSKLDLVVALLQRPEGARIAQIQEQTGWQAHSVRSVISGALKKKLGLIIVSTVEDSGRVYRIATTQTVA